MGSLEGRLILLGVTGSIAAYKSAELARALTAAGADVQPLMTHTAQAFLGPLTLQTLTRRRPMTDPLELLPDQRIAHIVAADSADLILVAPATARWMAAMAAGLADDVDHGHVPRLGGAGRRRAGDGRRDVRPSGDARQRREAARRSATRSSSPSTDRSPRARSARAGWPSRQTILAAVDRALEGRPIRQPDPDAAATGRRSARRAHDLAGWHVVVTAGGTAEPIDPVRYIGNRSTGKMGVAIAEAALARGARVTLIHGMTSVPLPDGADARLRADARPRCARRCWPRSPDADALVMAAAVADFRPRDAVGHEDRPRRRRPDARARADAATSWPRPCASRARDPRTRDAVDRRLRGRDRLAGPRAREGRAQGRRPARRQRRGGGRVGLRHGHEPGDDRRARRAGRSVAADVQAPGRRSAARSADRTRVAATVQNWQPR